MGLMSVGSPVKENFKIPFALARFASGKTGLESLMDVGEPQAENKSTNKTKIPNTFLGAVTDRIVTTPTQKINVYRTHVWEQKSHVKK